MEKTSFLFEAASRAYLAKLTPDARAFIEKNDADYKEKVRALDKHHEENRKDHIEKRFQELLQKNTPELVYTPDGVTTRFKTREKLESEAAEQIDQAYSDARERTILEGREIERKFVEKELGIEGNARADRGRGGIGRGD